MQKHIFKGTEKIKKNYEVVFKIWAKKKSGPTIHPIHPIPSHPIHPIPSSVNKIIGGGAWYPVAGYWARVVKGWNTVHGKFTYNPPLANTNTGPTVQICVIPSQLGLIAQL